MNSGLPRFADGVGGLLEFLAGNEVDRLIELPPVAQAVDEEEIDVIGPQRRQALVDHFQKIFRGPRHVLGDKEDLLANLGGLREPSLEERLGAVDLGGIEQANAVGESLREDVSVLPVAPRPARGSSPRRRSSPAFAWGARSLPWMACCADRPGAMLRGRGRRDCTRLEKLATIGPVHVVVAHLDRLLITKDWKRRLPRLPFVQPCNKSAGGNFSRCHGPHSPSPHSNLFLLPAGNGSALRISPVSASRVAERSHREQTSRPAACAVWHRWRCRQFPEILDPIAESPLPVGSRQSLSRFVVLGSNLFSLSLDQRMFERIDP